MTPQELFDAHKTDALKRAHNLARKYRFDFDDMRQELLKTLWNAACDFKPSLGIPFYPYLQQRMTWDALHLAYPKTDNHKPLTISLNEYDDDESQSLIDRADEYAEKISGSEGEYRLMSRAADILEIIDTSDAITKEERKALQKLIDCFEEGTEPKVYSTQLRNGLKKIRQLLNVPCLSPKPYSVDRKKLAADILNLITEDEIIVRDVHRQLITRSPYKEMSKTGLGLMKLRTELTAMGVKLFTVKGQGTKFNPLRFQRSELETSA